MSSESQLTLIANFFVYDMGTNLFNDIDDSPRIESTIF